MAPTRHNFFSSPPFSYAKLVPSLLLSPPCQSPRKAKDDSLALFHFRVLLSRRRKLNLLPEVGEINMCLKLAYLREATVCKPLRKKIRQFISLLGVRRDVKSAIFLTGNWSFSFPQKKTPRNTTHKIRKEKSLIGGGLPRRQNKQSVSLIIFFLFVIYGKWCVAADGLFVVVSLAPLKSGSVLLGRPGNPWMDLISSPLPSLAGCVVVFCGLGFCGERGGEGATWDIFLRNKGRGKKSFYYGSLLFASPLPSFLRPKRRTHKEVEEGGGSV